MDMPARSVVWSCMSHLNPDERKEAVEMLVFLGLTSSNTFKLDIHSLRQQYRKYRSSGLIIDGDEGNNNKVGINRTITDIDHPNLSTAQRCMDGNRFFRLNSMTNYPFADEYGTVNEVLQAKSSTIPLWHMGIPARAKVIQTTYNSMLNGRRSMRIPDIPDALADLGLPMPSKILTALYSIGIQLESVVLGKNTNVAISLDQFIRFIEICLNPRMMKRIEAADLQQSNHEDDRGSDFDSFATDTPEITRSVRAAKAKSTRPSQRLASYEEERPIRERPHGGLREETQSSRQMRRPASASRTTRVPPPPRLLSDEEPFVSSDDRRESADTRSSASSFGSRPKRGGLLVETASSSTRRREAPIGRVRMPADDIALSSAESATLYRETHAARLRKAKSKIAAEIMADKQRHSDRPQRIVVRSVPSHDDYSIGSSGDDVIARVPRQFESLKVRVARSPASGRPQSPLSLSGNSSKLITQDARELSYRQFNVLDSAEEFLKARSSSPRPTVLSRPSSPPRVTLSRPSSPAASVLHTSRPLSPLRSSFIVSSSPRERQLNNNDEREVFTLQNDKVEGWKPAAGGWVAEFSTHRIESPSRSASPISSKSQRRATSPQFTMSPQFSSLRNKNLLDEMIDQEMEAYHERAELRAYSRCIPNVSVTHTVSLTDPLNFHHTSLITDSMKSFQKELLSSQKLISVHEESSESVDSEEPNRVRYLSELTSAKNNVNPSVTLNTDEPTQLHLSVVDESVEKIASLVISKHAALSTELFNELENSDDSFSFSNSPRNAQHISTLSDLASSEGSETRDILLSDNANTIVI